MELLSVGEVAPVSLYESVNNGEVLCVSMMESLTLWSVMSISVQLSVSRRAILSSKEILGALERRGCLIDPFVGEAWSIEMVVGIPLSSTVKVCSVTCKHRNDPYALGFSTLYLLAQMLVGKGTSGGWSTHTNFLIENLDSVETFRSKYVLYQC